MKRYHMEPTPLAGGLLGWCVFDRLRGSAPYGDRRSVARCWRSDDAQRIVDLLNAAEPNGGAL